MSRGRPRALQAARDVELFDGLRGGTRRRREREQGDAGHERAATPEPVANAPPTRISADINNAYPSTTQASFAASERRSTWIDGSATLTALESMNAMLEPAIVTAKTQDDVRPRVAALRRMKHYCHSTSMP